MSDFKPQDNEARNTIEHALDETLFVEAGAGTGKTTSLVNRILELVGSGATTLDKVAAITFTEAAAAELRERIRTELEKAAENDSLREDRRNLCRQGVEQLDSASIQTLHSFAGSLLQERPLEAGLPPSFDTMDAIESDLAFEESWAQWIDAALDDAALQPHFLMTFSLGLTIDGLREIALKFHENYDLLADVVFAAESAPNTGASSAAAMLANSISELEALCQYSLLGEEDVLYAHTQAKLTSIRRLTTLDKVSPATYRLMSRILPLRQRGGRQSDWGKDALSGENACKTLKALLLELDTNVSDSLAHARTTALVPLLTALRAFVLNYADERKRQGRAGFHDLLVWARNMLRDNLDARDHFRRRFSHLLIDEVQDTDLIQAEIAMFLAEAVPSETRAEKRPRDWQTITPERGKLFVVGDPKQSIYRFRRADVRQMRRLQERMNGETLQLVQNFRSQRPVVEWVNTLFDKWMAQDGGEQAEYTPITHRWAADTTHPAAPQVWALGNEADGNEDGRIAEVRRRETADIATLLHQIVGEQWQVLDSDEPVDDSGNERYKDAKYSDICILMPTRTALRTLELALDEANAPYRLEGASLFFDTQEVRDLLNCLRAIDDPSDEVSIVAALRSPAFACTDIDLLQFHQARRTFNYLSHQGSRQSAEISVSKVADALEVLRRAHDKRMWTATAALIDGFLRDRLLMESAIGQPRTREQWRRYRFLVEQARAFAAAGGNSLRSFLEWVQRQADEGARVTETPVPESDEDAVRIMTVHASKGLEFPVVILTGLNTGRNARVDRVIFDDDNVEVGVGSGNSIFQTAGYEEKVDQEKVLDDHEHVRLLYVATTRARDHLVLSMHRPAKSNANLDSTKISAYLEDHDDLWKQVELQSEHQVRAMIQETQDAAQSQQPFDRAEHTLKARDEWQSKRQEVIITQGKPASVAATRLANVVKDEADADSGAEDMHASRRGRGGAALGRAVHAVLQTIDLETGDGIPETARAQATAEGIPQLQSDIEDLASTAVNSDIVKRAVASGRYWREAPMAAPIGEGEDVGVLEGFIDLLFEEDGELVVVDYKTDNINANAAEYIANNRYREQAGSYALITERATQKPVKDVVFLFLRPRSEHSMEDLKSLKANAEREAKQYLTVQTR